MSRLLAIVFALLAGCLRAPIYKVDATFTVADAVWFEAEKTLYVFWEIETSDELGPQAYVELAVARSEWQDVGSLDTVHEHVDVDCGPLRLCGSTSIAMAGEPSYVDLRLRLSPAGLRIDVSDVDLNWVADDGGPASRSLLVYGVFDESNDALQWRVRNQFPTLRNMDVARFGLRRTVHVDHVTHGNTDLSGRGNPYGFHVPCPDDFEPVDMAPFAFDERAAFHPDKLPASTRDSGVFCAQVTVQDGRFAHTTWATARRNPEVGPAFPVLFSPVEDAVAVHAVVSTCTQEEGASDFGDVQRQRLMMDAVPPICVTNPEDARSRVTLVAALDDLVSDARRAGQDMVLVVAIPDDDPVLEGFIQSALAVLVPSERHRSSPRLAGAFVYAASQRGLRSGALEQNTLWCPALPIGDGQNTCPTQPDQDSGVDGVDLGSLDILPDRDAYVDFRAEFPEQETGLMEDLRFLVPRFTPTTTHRDAGEFGVVTVLNQESISLGPDDALSYCPQEDGPPVVFSAEGMLANDSRAAAFAACRDGDLPEHVCDTLDAGAVGLDALTAWHEWHPETRYDVGLLWEFPFLTRMQYRTVVAGEASLLGLSVPFGIGSSETEYVGADAWLRESFRLDQTLFQCRRFCDHPTFDSAGVYQPNVRFRETYAERCYEPQLPSREDTGGPLDP